MPQPQQSRPRSLRQCFWHANGNMTCKTVVASTITPAQYVQFNTFSSSNANYQPNAYRSKHGWYADQNRPCCSVPCRSGCRGGSAPAQSHQSPPRDHHKASGAAAHETDAELSAEEMGGAASWVPES